MKKIFMIVNLILLSFLLKAQSQFDFWDDIDLGPTSTEFFLGPQNNWGCTHGTPTYNPTQIYLFHRYDDDGPAIGEGVTRAYNFLPNTEYIITLGVLSYKFPPIHYGNENKGSFKILLANNVTIASGSPGQPIPTFPSSQIIYTYTGEDEFYDKTLVLHFTTGNQAFSNIVIYPEATDKPTLVTLTFDCMMLFSCPVSGNKYYFDSSIPSGVLNQSAAYVGSSYGSTSTMTSSNPDATTVVYASDQIILQPNTTLSVKNSNIFDMSIVTKCDYPFVVPQNFVHGSFKDYTCDGSASKPSKSSNVADDDMSIDETKSNSFIEIGSNRYLDNEINNFLLTPNPAKDILTVRFNLINESDVKINIMDLSGRTVSSKSFYKLKQGVQNQSLDISKLYSGTYIFELISNKGKINKMFVVTK